MVYMHLFNNNKCKSLLYFTKNTNNMNNPGKLIAEIYFSCHE